MNVKGKTLVPQAQKLYALAIISNNYIPICLQRTSRLSQFKYFRFAILKLAHPRSCFHLNNIDFDAAHKWKIMKLYHYHTLFFECIFSRTSVTASEHIRRYLKLFDIKGKKKRKTQTRCLCFHLLTCLFSMNALYGKPKQYYFWLP